MCVCVCENLVYVKVVFHLYIDDMPTLIVSGFFSDHLQVDVI